MRAAIVRAGIAALSTIIFAAACTDHKDLLSPPTQMEAALAPAPGRCISIVLCTPRPNWIDLSAGAAVTCAVHSQPLLTIPTQSNLFCWGDNYNFMLGVGMTAERCPGGYSYNVSPTSCSTVPLPVAGTRQFASVSVGATHVCAIESGTAQAFCWGNNANGQLGLGFARVGYVGTPTDPVDNFTFNSVAAGTGQTCGVTTAQDIVCWGGSFGVTPVMQSNGVDKFVSVTLEGPPSATVVCGLTTSGGTCGGFRSPYSVLGQGTTANHFCQITSSQVECWGENSQGQLGTPTSKQTSAPSSRPVQVLGTFQSVATGELHTCALSGTDAFCWGHNFAGELGDETQGSKSVPTKVSSPWGTTLVFAKIAVGAEHTCGLANNQIWCWGRNDSGQLGLGTTFTWLTYPTYAPVVGSSIAQKVSGT
jgi:alpha-tubulin suppressor-like RCC1 family protein